MPRVAAAGSSWRRARRVAMVGRGDWYFWDIGDFGLGGEEYDLLDGASEVGVYFVFTVGEVEDGEFLFLGGGMVHPYLDDGVFSFYFEAE